jgi:nucleotide-binding universal stress UspA family protein
MEELTVREILFPTDYSDISANAGRTAAQLAGHFGARLHVVHVIPPVTDPGPAGALPRAIAKLGPGVDVDIVTAILTGRPAREIAEYAARHDIDLIVMGTHGRTGVSRALLGSVAEAVVRRAPCRVLTVPTAVGAEVSAETPPGDAPCIVCGESSPDLVCVACRRLIRDELREPAQPAALRTGKATVKVVPRPISD